jgi:RimJ/RimL family protein N-acetyltransferase
VKKYLEGDFVYLKEMTEGDFADVIKWRNNTENNKYLNQDFVLTQDLQLKWYERYLESENEILYIIHNKNGKGIGTLGATDIDLKNHELVVGRLLIGEANYRLGPYLIETCKLFYDYFFYELEIERIYGYVVKENKNARALDRNFGFVETNKIAHPNHSQIGDFDILEIINTPTTYNNALIKLIPILDHFKTRNTCS